MKEFIEYVLQYGNLNKQQIDLITSKATEIELCKDDFYWEAGKTVRKIGFLMDGVLRVYYYNNKGEEITRYFIDENHLILAGNMVDEVYTPSEYLSAITDCKIVVSAKQEWKEIGENDLILSGNTVDEVYTPSEYLSAITDCQMVVFSKQDWKEIGVTIIGWDAIIQKIITKHHSEKISRRSELISQDAKERYLDF